MNFFYEIFISASSDVQDPVSFQLTKCRTRIHTVDNKEMYSEPAEDRTLEKAVWDMQICPLLAIPTGNKCNSFNFQEIVNT